MPSHVSTVAANCRSPVKRQLLLSPGPWNTHPVWSTSRKIWLIDHGLRHIHASHASITTNALISLMVTAVTRLTVCCLPSPKLVVLSQPELSRDGYPAPIRIHRCINLLPKQLVCYARQHQSTANVDFTTSFSIFIFSNMRPAVKFISPQQIFRCLTLKNSFDFKI